MIIMLLYNSLKLCKKNIYKNINSFWYNKYLGLNGLPRIDLYNIICQVKKYT